MHGNCNNKCATYTGCLLGEKIMGKIIDIEIHSIKQTPVISLDNNGNMIMKMISEQLKKKEKEKERNNAINDT
jgi:hypothetical protein